MRKKTENLEAYDYMLRGTEYVRRRTRSENSKARQMFEKAIDIDPDFASAYVGLGQTYQVQVSFGWAEFPIQVLQQAKDLARKALSLEKSNADAYALLGLVYTFDGQYDKAINILEEGVSRNSDWVGNHIILAHDDFLLVLCHRQIKIFFGLSMSWHFLALRSGYRCPGICELISNI